MLNCLPSRETKYYHEPMTDNSSSIIREMLSPMNPLPTDLGAELHVPSGIKAVLFDIYGTLLISGTGDIGVSSRQRETPDIGSILKMSGFSVNPPGDAERIPDLLNRYIRACHSELRQQGVDYPEVDIRDIWKKVLDELRADGLLTNNPGDSSVDLLALRHELLVNPVWPMPGFPEITAELRKAGFHIGIISNAQFYTPLILEALTGTTLPRTGFETDLCTWSYKERRAKPSTGLFSAPLNRLQKMGISPEEVLYVGNDMLNDVSTASAAGCRTALFAGDRRSLRLRKGDENITVKPDMIITELLQLKTLI